MGTNGENSTFIETKKLFTYGSEPTHPPSFQSVKDYIKSWISLLQFKNFFLQTIIILLIIAILLFVHTRKKDSKDFQLKTIPFTNKPTCFENAGRFVFFFII